MTVAAVSTVRNESDIIVFTLCHLIAEGIDRIYLAEGLSDDDTRTKIAVVDAMFPGRITVVTDGDAYHYQPKWINRLAEMAGHAGYDWVLPFDADEFFYAVDRDKTIAQALDGLSPSITKLYIDGFEHLDWDRMVPSSYRMPKVAFRWSAWTTVANGNHEVTTSGYAVGNVLQFRELHYRGREHFQRKVFERVDRIDPRLPLSDGAHQRQYRDLTDDEFSAKWEELQARPFVVDPIPTRAEAYR